MQTYASYFGAVIDVLCQGDEAAAMQLVGSTGSLVRLVEDDLTVAEALSYAAVLIELGRDVEAEEVVAAIVGTRLAHTPLGDQRRVLQTPQGGQGLLEA
jgi:hypothetical protein